MKLKGHESTWERARTIANQLTDGFFGSGFSQNFDAMKAGNVSTDNGNSAYCWAYFGVTPWFVDELTRFYTVNPAAGVGKVQHLHACRLWTGEWEERDELGRIESAHGTCEALRHAITIAVQNALECWRGDGVGGYEWIGHAMHMIEDSFAPGHTKRDPENMDLVDMCTSTRPYSHMEESGLFPVQVPAHSDGGADEIWRNDDWLKPVAQAAVLADVGFLLTVHNLLTYIQFHQNWNLDEVKRMARNRLEEYFNNDSFVTIPDLPGAMTPTANNLYKTSGYFRTTRLSQEVPVYIEKFISDREPLWISYTPFYINGHRHFLAYRRDTGAFGLYAAVPYENETNAGGRLACYMISDGNLGANWDHLAPFAGNDGTAWILAYHGNTGEMGMFRIREEPAGIERVAFSQTSWHIGLESLVPIQDTQAGMYAFGYEPQTGMAIIGRVNISDSSKATFSTTILTGMDRGYTYIQPISIFHPPASCLLLRDAHSGCVRIERLNLASLSGKTIATSAVMSRLGDLVWDPQWTYMIPFTTERWVCRELGPQTYLLLYRPLASETQMRLVRLQFSSTNILEAAPIIREGRVISEETLNLSHDIVEAILRDCKLIPFYPIEGVQDFLFVSSQKLLMNRWRNEVEADVQDYPPYYMPFIANKRSGSREVHKEDCGWVKKMNPRNKIPYHSLQEAIDDGFDGCHYCLNEYDSR